MIWSREPQAARAHRMALEAVELALVSMPDTAEVDPDLHADHFKALSALERSAAALQYLDSVYTARRLHERSSRRSKGFWRLPKIRTILGSSPKDESLGGEEESSVPKKDL